MYYELVKLEQFYEAVQQITYREDDIKEAKEFGCKSILICYKRMDHLFAKYFVVYDSTDRPIVTVALQRNGQIIFFIDEVVDNHIELVRLLKTLAKTVTDCCGPIMTKTAFWYTEAQRINKLIGFKPLVIHDYFGIYYLGDK